LHKAVVDRRQDVAELIVQNTPDVPGLYRDAPDQIDALLRMEHKSLYSLLKGKDVPLPLWAAAVFGDTNVIAKAIQAGAEIDKPGTDFWEETPLQGAVRSRQYDAAKLLLAAGANPSRKSPKRGRNTPLHDAARDGDGQMVALLLQYKADLNAVEEAGRTPLVVGVEMHALPVARRLLDAGADARNVETSKLDPDDDKELIRLLRKREAR
jgi:ankyrin repeat protein